jgi:hypothetical protein
VPIAHNQAQIQQASGVYNHHKHDKALVASRTVYQMLPEANIALKSLLNEVGLYFQLISATAFTLTVGIPTNKAMFNKAATGILNDALFKVC